MRKWFGVVGSIKNDEISKEGVSSEEVREAFRVVLGRELRDEQAIQHFKNHCKSQLQLLSELLRSQEFLTGRGQQLNKVGAFDIPDLDVFKSFDRYTGPGTKGSVTDFLGIRTDVRFISHLSHMDGLVEGYPVPSGNFHGDINEWVGTLLSVLAEKQTLTVFELGAGWAPWLVVAAKAAAQHGIKDIRLVGVEGSSGHFDFMQRHFENNGLNPSQHRLLHGVVGVKDGTAQFPIASDPAADWGQAALDEAAKPGSLDYRGAVVNAMESVRAYSLETLLQEHDVVSLIHFDIQGAEADVIESGIRCLTDKAKALVVGTHRRSIEDRIHAVLRDANWHLCRDAACRVGLGPQTGILMADGCQFWRNSRYFPT